MKILAFVFLSALGVAAGLFFGFGNYAGLLGSIIPGIVFGILVSAPYIRERDWRSSAILVAFTLLGSIVAAYVSDENYLKRFAREQNNLYIQCGSYRLGQSSHGSTP